MGQRISAIAAPQGPEKEQRDLAVGTGDGYAAPCGPRFTPRPSDSSDSREPSPARYRDAVSRHLGRHGSASTLPDPFDGGATPPSSRASLCSSVACQSIDGATANSSSELLGLASQSRTSSDSFVSSDSRAAPGARALAASPDLVVTPPRPQSHEWVCIHVEGSGEGSPGRGMTPPDLDIAALREALADVAQPLVAPQLDARSPRPSCDITPLLSPPHGPQRADATLAPESRAWWLRRLFALASADRLPEVATADASEFKSEAEMNDEVASVQPCVQPQDGTRHPRRRFYPELGVNLPVGGGNNALGLWTDSRLAGRSTLLPPPVVWEQRQRGPAEPVVFESLPVRTIRLPSLPPYGMR